MELRELLKKIEMKDDLADFVEKLRDDLIINGNKWENPELERFPEAMSAWIGSMENFYRNLGKDFPSQPKWKTFAEILLAATSRIYEFICG